MVSVIAMRPTAQLPVSNLRVMLCSRTRIHSVLSLGTLNIELQLVRSRWNPNGGKGCGQLMRVFGLANMGINAPAPPRQLR